MTIRLGFRVKVDVKKPGFSVRTDHRSIPRENNRSYFTFVVSFNYKCMQSNLFLAPTLNNSSVGGLTYRDAS